LLLVPTTLTNGWTVTVPAPTGISPKVDRVSKNSAWLAKFAGPKAPSTSAELFNDQASLTSAPASTPTSEVSDAFTVAAVGTDTVRAGVSGKNPTAGEIVSGPAVQLDWGAGRAAAGPAPGWGGNCHLPVLPCRGPVVVAGGP